MSLSASSSALYLSLPPLSSTTRPPTQINVHPSVIASILTHHQRRSDDNAPRGLGALMGQRNETGTEVEVRSCFAVPHSEDSESIALDMHFQQSMVELLGKNGIKEQVVGWYATSPEINAYSALIQNYFSEQIQPNPAVHITVDTKLTENGEGLGVKGYVSMPLGINPKPENCMFLPVPVSIKFSDSERPALDLLTSSQPNQSPALPPLSTLSTSLTQLSTLLDQCLDYVKSVNSGQTQPDPSVGRYLLEGVGRWSPSSNEQTDDEAGVPAGLQDTLTIAYLANLLRSQVELGGRLALLQQAPQQTQT